MPLDPVFTGDGHVTAHNAEREAINQLEEDVAAKIDKPTNPAIGSTLVYDGTKWAKSQSRLFEGTGHPEGVVAAPVGSRYIDISEGGTGAVEFIKARGDSPLDNTGWMLIAGDTGWRNVSGMIDRRSTAIVHAAWLRRVNNVIDMFIDITTPTNTSSPWELMTLPTGFRPDFTRYGVLHRVVDQAFGWAQVTSDGIVSAHSGIEAGVRQRLNGTWTTTKAWPSSLPGTEM